MKTTLNPNNGDFYEIALGFIDVLYQSVIHKAHYLNFYWYNHLDRMYQAEYLSQVPEKLLDYYSS